MSQRKKKIISDAFYYAGANYLAQAIGILNSIFLRRFLGPASMGMWSILQVVLGYCGYASFGTTKALMRDYPYLRGKGQLEEASHLKDMILTFSLLMSAIPAVVIVLYVKVQWIHLERPMRIGLIAIAGFLFIQRFYDLVLALLRSEKKFTLLGKLIVINAIGGLLVSLGFVSRWNIYGLLLGTAGLTFLSIYLVYKWNPYTFRYFWHTGRLWQELKLGIPLVAIAFMAEFLKSMDKLILAKKVGFYDVGLYSIAMMVSSYAYSFPMMFSHVLFPNLQEAYGRKGSAEGIKHYLLTPVLGMTTLIPLICGVAIFLMPVVAKTFLPKFIPGLFPMKIYLMGTFFLILAQFSQNYLVTLDNYLINIPIIALSIATNFALNTYFLKCGRGLAGVASGTAISFMVFGLLSYFAAMKNFANLTEIGYKLGSLLLTLSYLFGLIFLLDHFVQFNAFLLPELLKIAILILFSAPFLFQLEKKIQLFLHLKEVLLARFKPGTPELGTKYD
jgi:O-antigen/teichoic acid export membrane protein